MTDRSVELLRAAIYKRAVLDYYEALITFDYQQIESIEKFFKSGAYYIKPEKGAYIIEKSKRELETVKKFVDEFLKSEETSIKIEPAKTSPIPLKILVSIKFQEILLLRKDEEKNELYLRKKPLKMA